MARLELTNIDDRLYEALQLRAMQDNRSVSEEAEIILRESLAMAKPSRNAKEADEAFMGLLGSWQDHRTADEIIADIRSSRRTGERFGDGTRVFD